MWVTTLKATDFIALGATTLFVIVGVGFYGWLKILKETNKLLKEQNVELKEENKNWTEKHNQNVKNIATMQGQIEILQKIPLVNIDSTLKQIAEFNKNLAETNKAILETLKGDAVIAKKQQGDGGLLVKTKDGDDPSS